VFSKLDEWYRKTRSPGRKQLPILRSAPLDAAVVSAKQV
jgi:hypothetical protein